MLNGIPRILIIRLSAIGDVVRVLPALECLREAHPHAQIDWVVEAKAAGVLSEHPSLDQVLVFERGAGARENLRRFRQLMKQVRANRYDIVLDFHGILKSGLLMAASRAEERYGFARPRAQELSWLFAKKRTALSSQRLNRIEENLLLCENVAPRLQSLEAHISVPPEVEDDVEAFYERAFDGGKRIVVLHVPVDRPEKQWPLEYFAVLGDLLDADGRFNVLLAWGPGQFEAVSQVARSARRNLQVAPETVTLKHYAWMVHQADLFVGGDTGPMHIASAMGVPVVALFGGTDPLKHGPYREPSRCLYADGPPEAWRPADVVEAQARLRRLTPEMVYDACVKLLACAP
jgi:lipopolysaccharide heptosyltransferase I